MEIKVEIKRISEKQIKKIIDSGKLNCHIVCARLEKIKEFPIGILASKASPYKLLLGKLYIDNSSPSWTSNLKNKEKNNLVWSWTPFPVPIHNAISHIFNKKGKITFNEWRYFELIYENTHPLDVAKKYFIKKQDYEMAHTIREYIRNEKKKKKSEVIIKSEIFINRNTYNIKMKKGDKHGSSKTKTR